MSKKELIKRYILFFISLFFTGLGVALTKHGELGVSPISSMANVFSIKYTFFSFGDWLAATNYLLLFLQILLLRKNFKPILLLQIPISFIFGYFTDFGLWLIKDIPNNIYLLQLIFVLLGIVVLAFGIALGVIANVVLNSGEAFVKVLSDVTKKDFGNVKLFFDVSWVLLSIIFSLIFFDGKLYGTREGTIISALLVGVTVKFFTSILQEPLEKVLKR